MTTRRQLLASLCASGGSLVAGCVVSTPRQQNPPDDTETKAGTPGATPTPEETEEPYTIGPSEPGCPGQSQNASKHWGNMETRAEHVNETVTEPNEAEKLVREFDDYYDEVEVVVPEVDTIEWMGDTYNITAESQSGDWFVVHSDASRFATVLLIPQGNRTLVREYFVGYC